tara:strand:- start:781 stop:1263 length:483 start_codon:yes stop_codon:yes gene_type:complete
MKAADLQKPTTFVVKTVGHDEFEDGEKPVVTFEDGKKLVLNKTNGIRIADMYGEETDNWVGNSITLHSERVEFRGEMRDGIRVKLDGVKPDKSDNNLITKNQQVGLKNEYESNEWPPDAARQLVKEIAGVDSLAKIQKKFLSDLMTYFSDSYQGADDIPF